MGTSTDRTEGRGGPWTPLKYAATSYVRGLGAASDRDRARRVLARHVPVLGGAASAASSARAAAAAASRSARSLSGCPAWPGTFTSCTVRRSSSAAIASMVGWCLTGRRALVRQPLRRHPGSQVVTQSIAYWL